MKDKNQPETYYYKMTLEIDDPRVMGCVSKDDKGFKWRRFREGASFDDWPEGITLHLQGEVIPDFTLAAPEWSVFSEGLRQVFDDHKVEDIQFLPVQAVHNDTGEELGTYWTINVLRKVEALDWERTIWKKPSKIEDKYPRDEYPLLYIMEKALKQAPLKGVDCFRLTVNSHLAPGFMISRELKEAIEKRGATSGLYFVKVPAY
jgi:hypothetical protein